MHEIGRDEVDLDTGIPSNIARLCHRHVRDVDRGHLMAATRQPDRIPSLAGTHIEHPARLQVGEIADNELIGLSSPNRSLLAVAIVPKLALIHCAEIICRGVWQLRGR